MFSIIFKKNCISSMLGLNFQNGGVMQTQIIHVPPQMKVFIMVISI